MGGRYSERQPRTMTFSKYVYRDVKIDIRKAFTSPAGAVAFKGILGNAIQSGHEKKKQVDCKILGDPSITCSEVLLFYGVGKLYEGKYWLKTASHTINRYNGYTVQLELVGETVKPRFNTVQYERSVSDMQQRYSKSLGYTNYRTTDLRHRAKSKLLIEAQEEFNKNPDVQSLIYVIKNLDEDANGKLVLDHDQVKMNDYNDLNQSSNGSILYSFSFSLYAVRLNIFNIPEKKSETLISGICLAMSKVPEEVNDVLIVKVSIHGALTAAVEITTKVLAMSVEEILNE